MPLPLFGLYDELEGSWSVSIVGIMLTYIPSETFMMSAPSTDEYRYGNENQHTVRVGEFHLAETEVTQMQW